VVTDFRISELHSLNFDDYDSDLQTVPKKYFNCIIIIFMANSCKHGHEPTGSTKVGECLD
jgi:hypothetical protein